jgi:curli biogenesis system outer membrane secretion channel CsgG
MKDLIGACILGAILGCMFAYGLAEAQTYPMTNAQGYNMGTVQINGNTAQFVNPMGMTTQTATIYPNQIVITTPQGYATSVVGNTGYTVPPSPPTPSSPRVLQ